MDKKIYDVAAYIWPAYTGKEPRAHIFWEEKTGEWQTVRKAEPRFEGHRWPRKPLWGYQDEADPQTMEFQIEQATSHGINVFIYDWYWYDRRPFLEQCLNDGFLQAGNSGLMKFYLMWANHDALHLWDRRNSSDLDTIVWRGDVSRQDFEIVAKRLIEKYFHLPNYYTIDGKPVFAIYDLTNLMKGLGGKEGVRDAFCWFKAECVKAGLPGLHLQLIKQEAHNSNRSGLDGNVTALTPEMVDYLEVDSMTHYQYVHFTDIDRDYKDILEDVVTEWEHIDQKYRVSYYPHVTIGWDNNARFTSFREGIMRNNTPEMVQKALELAKAFTDRHPERPPLVTINSWNEWTEDSYLEPDDLNGYGYLDAVKNAFCEE